MDFAEFRYIYPPRPASSIQSEYLDKYVNWIAQYKFNGTRNLIFVFPDGHIELYSRHREHNKAYKTSSQMREAFASLNLQAGCFHVFDGELMHSKTVGLKDRIVLFDVLVLNGQYLIGTKYISRYRQLQMLLGRPSIFENETPHKLGYRVNQNLWLAKIYTKDLKSRFQKLIHIDEVEGLVLKDPNGLLTPGNAEENNGDWQIRVRKPNKNYAY